LKPIDFDKDILISYAHIDDEALMEGDKGWIENFHRSLEIRLSQLLGYKPKIWRDPKLSGNDYFGDEIVDQFPKIALLISILSPRYINSEWCTKEVNEFINACKLNIGIRVNNKSRIFKVVKTPVDIEDHPEPIKGLLGYDFFQIDPQTGRSQEFNKMFGAESELAYWSKLNDVAHDIKELLKSIKPESSNSYSDNARAPDENQLKVYLAETSYNLTEFRENIKRELQEHGVLVFPDKSLPLIANEFRKSVNEMIESSDLSIHLVGNKYGIVPEGTNKSTIVLQNEIALDVSQQKNMKRLIWLPPDLIPEDKRQIDFLEHIKSSEEVQTGAELLESSIEDFKFTMLQHLNDLKESKANPLQESKEINATDAIAGPKLIYLICDQRDLDNIAELEDLLFNEGYEVITPIFDGEENQVRLDHQENLKTCDAVLIYYGEGNELWMRSKLRELLKIAGYGRTSPLQTKGVILAGPKKEYKARVRAHNTIIIDCTEGLSKEKIQPYFEKVNQIIA
jgi:hypothetical protein